MSELGDDVVIKAYFPGDRNIEELSSLIKEKIAFISNFLDIGKGFSSHSEIDEEDWANAWKKYFKPFSIAEGIVIKPTWEHYDAGQNEIIIQLDPGMAFGTGTHETTRLCAGLLKKYLKSGDSVIDLGCGTGILAIIAAKLGAKNIKAIDIDSVAVRITRENSELNNVSDKIEQYTGIMDDLAGKTVGLDKSATSYFFFLQALADSNIKEDQVNIVEMGSSDAGDAFLAGKIDAAVTWEPFLSSAGKREGGHILVSSAEYPRAIIDVLTVNSNFSKENPAFDSCSGSR
jgi:ribosomal protein L11 methylase PrmA